MLDIVVSQDQMPVIKAWEEALSTGRSGRHDRGRFAAATSY
jgi:hypothetical protein